MASAGDASSLLGMVSVEGPTRVRDQRQSLPTQDAERSEAEVQMPEARTSGLRRSSCSVNGYRRTARVNGRGNQVKTQICAMVAHVLSGSGCDHHRSHASSDGWR